MHGWLIAIIYLAPFLAIGLAVKLLADRWMGRGSLGLANIRALVGPRRQRRRAFLLGAWRDEDPE
jgi:hypothetical protein